MIENYVIGATGFVGRHLMKGLPPEFTHTIPGHLAHLTPRLKPHKRLFYLAAYGNMASHDQSSVEILNANLSGPLELIRRIKAGYIECECFIYMSTSSVNLPVQTAYSRTKRAAEEMLLAYPEIPTLIIRPYSITGVGEQKEHLIPKLIRSCMEGERMDFVGEPTHDWIDVRDVVGALLLLSEKKCRGIYEIGTGFLNSNDHILAMVEEACGKKANINRIKSMRSYDSDYWCCESPFAAKDMGWFPIWRIKDSIREMVEAYKNEHA